MAARALLWYSSFTIAFIFAIAQIYACNRFQSLRSLIIIQKRYPDLILTEAIAVIIWSLTAFPFWSNILFGGTKFGMTHQAFEVYKILVLSIIAAMTHFIVLIEVSRLWLISFNLHCLHSSQNEKWKSQIDESFAKKDWYLKNRNTFGNEKYLIRRVFIYYLCIATLSVSLYCITFTLGSGPRFVFIASVSDGILSLISLSVSLYIYYKCRNYHVLNDNLYFWYEIRATSVIWIVSIICYFGVQLLNWFFYDHTVIKLISDCLFVGALLFATVAPSFLSTIVIPRKIIQSKIWHKELLNKESYEMGSINSSASINSVPSGSFAEDAADVGSNLLRQTLRNETKFELFIQWMYKEFSAEAGLCFIEMVQFKQSLMDYLKKDSTEFENGYENLLYASVPESSIVFADVSKVEGIAKYKSIAHRLFDKYIRPNAEFEINISHYVRLKYIKLDKQNWNLEGEKLIQVFDKIVEEMFLFMLQSFTRYQQHSQFDACSSV